MNRLAKILMLPLLRIIAFTAARKRSGQFQSRDPRAAQREIFQKLIKNASETHFGKDYEFQCLARLPFEQAYDAYRALVPIRTYHDFWNDYFGVNQGAAPDGKKMLRLENVTWPGRVELFCETSGTTAPTKYIPFSSQMFKENRRAVIDLIACYLTKHPESRIPQGKILYMSGSTDLTEMEPGIYSGDMSAITLRFRPWYLVPFVEPGPDVSALPWEEKLAAMAGLLLRDRDIRVISGVPPWIILLLRCCREIAGKPLPEILPQLELIIHGGTSLKPYLAELRELFEAKLPNLIELLPSSEAFMGFQCAGDAAMRLTPYYGVFFEFVRFEDLDDTGRPASHATAIPLEQVETGQRYAVILSTCAGLWRYHIGDTLRFTSLSPHFIEFTGRDRFLDKLEEKVTQEEVEQVIVELNRSVECGVREFIVGTDVPGRRHVWVLAGIEEDAVQLVQQLDNHLRRLNADYSTFREQGRISAPEVVKVSPDLIYEWSKTVRGKLGGQSKIPHIDPTPDGSMVMSLKDYSLKRAALLTHSSSLFVPRSPLPSSDNVYLTNSTVV